MTNLHIVRAHALGLAKARKIAFSWAEQVEDELGMTCNYEESRNGDRVCFSRSGVQGELQVTRDKFELDAQLGLLVGVFKGRIEAEISDLLDKLLAGPVSTPKGTAARKGAKK